MTWHKNQCQESKCNNRKKMEFVVTAGVHQGVCHYLLSSSLLSSYISRNIKQDIVQQLYGLAEQKYSKRELPDVRMSGW